MTTRRARKPAPPRPLEKEVQKGVAAALRAEGCEVFRRNVLALKKGKYYVKGAEPGQSDLWGKLPDGRHFECELKRPRERPTDAQLLWLLRMNGRGADGSVAFWVDNVADALQVVRRVKAGWRVVYDDGPGARPGDFHLEPPPGEG